MYSFRKDYYVGMFGWFKFCVGYGDGIGGMGPRTALTTKSLIVRLIVLILCHLRVRIIDILVIHRSTGHTIHQILGNRIIVVLLVMDEVVFILGQPTYPPKKIILVDTGMMCVLIHIIDSAQYPTWYNNLVGVNNIMLQVILNLVFQLVMIKAVGVLGTLTFISIKMIVV